MTLQAVDWLPEEVFAPAAVKALFEPVVDAWSQNWFVKAGPVVSSVEFVEAAAPAAQRLSGKVVCLELHGRGKRYLLEAALGLDLTEHQLIDGDRRLLEEFASEILGDLIQRLESDIRAVVAADGDQVAAVLSMGPSEVLSILYPRHLLVSRLRNGFGPPAPSRGPLGARTAALKTSRVTANAILGRVELSMDEIEGLAVGDVLVLDRSLDDPTELRTTDGRLIVSGRLRNENGQLLIQA